MTSPVLTRSAVQAVHHQSGFCPARDIVGVGDDELLTRFVGQGDTAAFEALVHRHGPMVYAVCRRLLTDPQDIDDAFQAVFLVLVRRAGTVRTQNTVGAWLYGVARKVSGRMRFQSRRGLLLLGTEVPDSPTPHGPEPLGSEEAAAVHEEIDRLPGLYRDVVVRHYVLGQTYDAIAVSLNCPKGTIATRLAEAKKRLHGRLAARGFGAVAIATLPQALAPQAVPAALMAATASQTPVPASVAATAAAVSQSMALGGLTKLAAVVVCLLGLAVLPVVVPPGLSRSPNPTSEKVEPVQPTNKFRPELGTLDAREVPAALASGLTWTYDAGSQTLDIQGTEKRDFINVGKDAGGQVIFTATSVKMNQPEAALNETVKTGIKANSQLTIRVSGNGDNDNLQITNSNFTATNGTAMKRMEASDYKLVVLSGGAGNDGLYGGLGTSHLYGGIGDDLLMANGPNARMFGEAGNDNLAVRGDIAEAKGGAGNDRFQFDTQTRAVPMAEFLKLNQDYSSGDTYSSKQNLKGNSYR